MGLERFLQGEERVGGRQLRVTFEPPLRRVDPAAVLTLAGHDRRDQLRPPVVLDAVGVPGSALPRLVDSSGVAAETSADVMGAAVPIAGMCGDQQASLFGLGCREAVRPPPSGA